MFKRFALKRFAKLEAPGASPGATRPSLMRRFSKADEGVAAVEFALLAPLLLTLMLGSIEITHSLWASGKLNQATDTVNDLIARASTITDADFANLLLAGPLILDPYPQNDLELTVTSIIGCLDDPDDIDSDMDYYVLWSRGWSGSAKASPHAQDATFSKQPSSLKVTHGETLLVTEGVYTYEPKIARKIATDIGMDSIAFNKPRDTDRVRFTGRDLTPERQCDDF